MTRKKPIGKLSLPAINNSTHKLLLLDRRKKPSAIADGFFLLSSSNSLCVLLFIAGKDNFPIGFFRVISHSYNREVRINYIFVIHI